MANTKSKTTKKAEDITKEEVKIEKQEVKAESNNERKKVTRFKSSIQVFDMNDDILLPVRKVAFGTVGYSCKNTNEFIKWDDFETQYMLSVKELKNMNGEDKMFLFEPLLIVDDEEFMEKMKLTDLYNAIFEVEDLNSFYAQSLDVVENNLDKLPKALRKQTLTRTVDMLKNEEIVNNTIGIIRLLKNKYKIDVDI